MFILHIRKNRDKNCENVLISFVYTLERINIKVFILLFRGRLWLAHDLFTCKRQFHELFSLALSYYVYVSTINVGANLSQPTKMVQNGHIKEFSSARSDSS